MSEPPERSDDVEAVVAAFTGEDPGDLLDGEAYGPDALEAERERLAADREEIASELDELEAEYEDQLRAAADADGPEREIAQQKAATTEKKHRVREQQYETNGRELAAVLTLAAIRDLRAAAGDDSLGVEALRRDEPAARAVRRELREALDRFDIDTSAL